MSITTIERKQMAYDIAANWTAQNPILAIGEFGHETGTNRIKIGDGVTPWNSLTTGLCLTTGNGGGAFAVGELTATTFASNDMISSAAGILLKSKYNANMQVFAEFAADSSYYKIQPILQGVGYKPLALCNDGGSVLIGNTVAVTASKAEVNGHLAILSNNALRLCNATNSEFVTINFDGTLRSNYPLAVTGEIYQTGVHRFPDSGVIQLGTSWGTRNLEFRGGATTYASLHSVNGLTLNVGDVIFTKGSSASIGTSDANNLLLKRGGTTIATVTAAGLDVVGRTTTTGNLLFNSLAASAIGTTDGNITFTKNSDTSLTIYMRGASSTKACNLTFA